MDTSPSTHTVPAAGKQSRHIWRGSTQGLGRLFHDYCIWFWIFWGGFFRSYLCCLAFVLLFLASITFFPHPHPYTPTSFVHLSTTMLIFTKLLLPSTSSLKACSVFLTLFSLIQIFQKQQNSSESVTDITLQPLYSSQIFFFFNHLFHFAANSTFVPWTNSITMTQPTAHSGLPCVSSRPLKPAQSPC